MLIHELLSQNRLVDEDLQCLSNIIHNNANAKVQGLVIHDILISDRFFSFEVCAIGNQSSGETGLGHTRLLLDPPTNHEFRRHAKYRSSHPSITWSQHIVFGESFTVKWIVYDYWIHQHPNFGHPKERELAENICSGAVKYLVIANSTIQKMQLI